MSASAVPGQATNKNTNANIGEMQKLPFEDFVGNRYLTERLGGSLQKLLQFWSGMAIFRIGCNLGLQRL